LGTNPPNVSIGNFKFEVHPQLGEFNYGFAVPQYGVPDPVRAPGWYVFVLRDTNNAIVAKYCTDNSNLLHESKTQQYSGSDCWETQGNKSVQYSNWHKVNNYLYQEEAVRITFSPRGFRSIVYQGRHPWDNYTYIFPEGTIRLEYGYGDPEAQAARAKAARKIRVVPTKPPVRSETATLKLRFEQMVYPGESWPQYHQHDNMDSPIGPIRMIGQTYISPFVIVTKINTLKVVQVVGNRNPWIEDYAKQQGADLFVLKKIGERFAIKIQPWASYYAKSESSGKATGRYDLTIGDTQSNQQVSLRINANGNFSVTDGEKLIRECSYSGSTASLTLGYRHSKILVKFQLDETVEHSATGALMGWDSPIKTIPIRMPDGTLTITIQS
jgi:hypothetical protein